MRATPYFGLQATFDVDHIFFRDSVCHVKKTLFKKSTFAQRFGLQSGHIQVDTEKMRFAERSSKVLMISGKR